MRKISVAIIAFVFCVAMTEKAYAAVAVMTIKGGSYITGGPTLENDKYVWRTTGLSDMKYEQYGDYKFTNKIASGSSSGASEGFGLGCNAYWIVSGNNGDFEMKAHVTGLSKNCEGYPSDPIEDDGGGDDGGETCDTCAIFDCPAWDEYMGKLNDIENSIPPAPDWDEVATTFQKKITPQIKKDMAELIGDEDMPEAPEKKAEPEQPKEPPKSIFEILDEVDERNRQKPTMKDTPDGRFDENDIKNVDPPEEKKDESGGFKIDDPMKSLPDASDFAKPKQDSIETPIPKQDNAPTPTPKQGTVTTPTPKQGTVTAPTPSDGEVETPTTGTVVETPIPKK